MARDERPRHFGIVTQVYPPDPAAVGQHLADVAEELGARGYKVSVFTADRGYDDPSQIYPRSSKKGNVTVIRLPLSSLGKGSIASRLLGGTSLLLQASVFTALDLRITDLLLSTIPHFTGALGIAMRVLRGLPFHYWLMDLNPDQIVALGKLSADSVPVKVFDLLNRGIIRYASSITTLDEAMAQRFAAKSDLKRAINVQPPWSVQPMRKSCPDVNGPFRERFGLSSERVLMHAGNHSVVHPLDTLVDAIRMRPGSVLKFFFVGGGLGKKPIEDWVSVEHPTNVTLLPYQPRESIDDMICAADVHVVSVGNGTVGIVHPSKLYGALAAGRPVLVIGPAQSPAARMVLENNLGWHVEHGNVGRMQNVLDAIEQMSEEDAQRLRQKCFEFAKKRLQREASIRKFCARLVGN